ncbi:hypothetical protein [Nocardia sp. CDC160]|uniref:hypothetical protein n=1 Tax=Nocardia sp. CDC160 TaxID=3112166 RepID=UPI002DB9EA7F|nr:hypothetical protein [Nocardia sp. CDC160]MEC3916228.1 hypothetical protein [Nocardia sp. CDC160]
MTIKNALVRTGLGVSIVAAAILTTAGTASAEITLEPTAVTQQNADISGFGSGSAAGSGHALGEMIGRLLFHNDN